MILGSALSAICASSVAATEAGDFTEMSLKELMGLEVFTAASLLETELTKAPGTVYSFNRGDFKRLGVRRLDDLLQFVPGFQLNQYRKRHNSIWARGLLDRYNDKLVLMVDGVRLRHLYYGHFSLGDNFPLEKIEKVEIILGPASSLYGANAFGGIISVQTRAFSEQPAAEASLELGNHERAKGSLLYNSKQFQAFASYLTQDAPFRDDRRSFIGGATAQPLDEDYTNLFLKANPLPGLTLMLDHYRNDTPFLFIPDTQDAFIEQRPLTLAARYEAGTVERGRLEASAYYTWDKAQEYEIEQQTRRLGYRENQDAAMAGVDLTGFRRLQKHVLAVGMSWRHERAQGMDFARYFHYSDGFLDPPVRGSLLSEPSIRNDDYALFVQDVWDLSSDLSLTLGGRYDRFDRFGGHFNYRAALVFNPDDQQTWKLLYGTAIRTPSFREYLKVLEGTDFLAPALDPERIRSLELGYLYQWEQANLSITLFNNEVKDYIHEVPTPDGADEYFANSDDPWRLRGVETLFQLRPVEHLDLRLGVAYLDAEERHVGELPYLAPWSGSFNLNYEFPAHRDLGVSLFYNGRRKDTNGYTEDDPNAFVLVNVHTTGPIDKRWSYAIGIDNLFDKRVYDAAADFGSQHNTEKSEREIWARLEWRPSL